MTSRQVESFLMAGKYLSFTKAAEALYMTRQAVSQQVGLLEEELGAELFIREQKRLRLSEPGKYYYDALRRMVREWGRIQENANKLAVRQEIRIGCIFAMNVAELLLGELPEEQQIYWERKEPFELIDDLLKGRFDLVITFEDSYLESSRQDQLLYRELMTVETLLTYRKQAEGEENLSVDEAMKYLAAHDGIISQDQLNEGKNQEKFRRLLQGFGIANPRIRLLPDRESVETMVENGRGYTIGTTAERFPFYPNMSVVHTGFLMKIVLLCRKDNTKKAVKQLFT